MVSMQDQADVKVAGRGCIGLFPLQHPEKVGGVIQGGIGCQDRLIVADAMPGGHQGRHLGDQADGAVEAGLAVHGVAVRLVHRKQGHTGLQHIHGPGVLRPVTHGLEDILGHLPQALDLLGEGFQMLDRGQNAEQQQIDGFHEGGAVGQILDAIAPVNQHPFFAVNKTDCGIGHGHPAQTGIFHTDFLAHRLLPSICYRSTKKSGIRPFPALAEAAPFPGQFGEGEES